MKLELKNTERKEFNVERVYTRTVSISYEQVEKELVAATQREHELEQQIVSMTTSLATAKANKQEFADMLKEMKKLIK